MVWDRYTYEVQGYFKQTDGTFAFFDLSPFVKELAWRFGGATENAFGTVLPGGSALVTLDNVGGEFNPFSPGAGIDPLPGPVIIINASPRGGSSQRCFSGWSNGITARSLITGEHEAILHVNGILQRIQEYQDDTFVRISGIQRTDEVLNALLDDIGVLGAFRTIREGNVRVLGSAIKEEAVGTQGSRRSSFSSAAKILAIAEVGRIFDNRLGRIEFENQTFRDTVPSARFTIGPIVEAGFDVDYKHVEALPLGNRVINVIHGDQDQFVSEGENVPIVFTVGLPITVTVPPGGLGYGVLLYVALSDQARADTVFVQSWTDLEEGTDYTYGPDVTPTVHVTETSIRIQVDNPTDMNQPLVITQVRGNSFRRTLGASLSLRSGDSIERYGQRVVQYPANVNADFLEMRRTMSALLDLHDGVDADGDPDLDNLRQVRVTVELDDEHYDSFLTADISDIVSLKAPEIGLNAASSWWVEGIEHVVDRDRRHRVTLDLVDTGSVASFDAALPDVPVPGRREGDETDYTLAMTVPSLEVTDGLDEQDYVLAMTVPSLEIDAEDTTNYTLSLTVPNLRIETQDMTNYTLAMTVPSLTIMGAPPPLDMQDYTLTLDTSDLTIEVEDSPVEPIAGGPDVDTENLVISQWRFVLDYRRRNPGASWGEAIIRVLRGWRG